MDYAGDGGSPQMGGGGGGGSQDSGRKRRTSQDEQTIRAVTINMMLSAQPQQMSDSQGLQLPDGRNLYHVKFVAAVRSVDDNSTHVMYQLEDGTGGLMDVKQWVDDGQDCSAVTELRQLCNREHVYLKIVGTLKDYDGRKMVLADAIRPLSTANEISHHFLEVVYQGEMHKKGGDMKMGGAAVHGFAGTPIMNRGAPLASGGNDGDSALRQAVIRGFTGDENGVSVFTVVNELRGQYTEEMIRKEITYLQSEGRLYSTIDEEHYNVSE